MCSLMQLRAQGNPSHLDYPSTGKETGPNPGPQKK